MYNKLTNRLKELLAKHKLNSLASYLTNLFPKVSSLERATKNVRKTIISNASTKKPDGSLAVTDICSSHNTNSTVEILNALLPVCLPVKHFTPNEVKYTIDNYHLNKSKFDLIKAEVARCLPKKAIIHLAHIFNSILRLLPNTLEILNYFFCPQA